MTTPEKTRRRQRINMTIALYIAFMVTVLAAGVWKSVGVNSDQNAKLSIANREIAIRGCTAENHSREKINHISGALVDLLRKSIAENERKGITLTPPQEAFVAREFRLLRPLPQITCAKHVK